MRDARRRFCMGNIGLVTEEQQIRWLDLDLHALSPLQSCQERIVTRNGRAEGTLK